MIPTEKLTQHTPGPWKVIHTRARKLEYNVATDNGAPIQAVIVEGLNNRDGNAQFNAQLIAAAPDLLEACTQTLDWLRKFGPQGEGFYLRDAIEAAIRKAEVHEFAR